MFPYRPVEFWHPLANAAYSFSNSFRLVLAIKRPSLDFGKCNYVLTRTDKEVKGQYVRIHNPFCDCKAGYTLCSLYRLATHQGRVWWL